MPTTTAELPIADMQSLLTQVAAAIPNTVIKGSSVGGTSAEAPVASAPPEE